MLYPMFALVLWTFVIAFRLLYLRVKTIKAGRLTLSQFRLHTGDIPDDILQTSKNYSNLFEIPVLFYVAGAVALALRTDSLAMTIAAWLFVLARIIHSGIHLTSNNVLHRFRAYAFGNLCVMVIWGLLLVDHATHYPIG